MKFFLSFLFVVIFCSLIQAQTEKGRIIIGMSTTLSTIGTGPELLGIGFSSTQVKIGDNTSEPIKKYGVNAVPKIGFFVEDNIAIGIDGNYSYSSMEIVYNGSKETSNFGGIGVFGRSYFPFSKVIPFIEIDAGIGKAIVETKSGNTYESDSKSESDFFNFGGGLGLALPLGKRTTLDFFVGYDFIQEKLDQTYYGKEVVSSTHSLGFEIGIMILLGTE